MVSIIRTIFVPGLMTNGFWKKRHALHFLQKYADVNNQVYIFMWKNKLLVCMLSLLLGWNLPATGQDSIRFSLLTCAPGPEIYALFGHTAIRYENFDRKIDLVFNYGMFSFNTPNFIMRFVKGETDYQLGIVPFRYFEAEYALRGSDVYQQELNLTQTEKEDLLHRLERSYLPENRTYRYNYFYDNCTTRARDRIEQSIAGQVVYGDSLNGRTYRSVVHEFTSGAEWSEFGIDLCLGKEADEDITQRQQMFSPFYMKHYASQARIVDAEGKTRPLVLAETKIVQGEPVEEVPEFPLSPMACASLFLLLCVLMAWGQWKTAKAYWGWTAFLLLLQGVAGCIIAFLFFFSIHPTVGSNWMLMWLNPLPLCYLPVLVYREIKGEKDYYHWVNLVYLTLFIAIVPLCGQKINLTVLPLALGLLVNSAAYVLVWKKKQ